MSAPDASNPVELSGFRATLRRDWTLALVVAALAALVRVVILVQFRSTILGQYVSMDAFGYQAWSLDIAGGHWLGDRVFYQEPLYPYLLALIHLVFGPGLLPVFVTQLVAGTVNCVLVQILAARVTQNRWAGLIAGLILAFYQTMVFYEIQVLKPVWEVMFLLLFVHTLLSAYERRRGWLWLMSGVLLALLGLTRGNALLYAPFVMVWAFLACRAAGWPRALKAVGLFAAGLAAPLLVVMLRNAVVGGDFVLSSSHAGFNFYIGNNAESDGIYRAITGVQEDPRFEGEDARLLASRMSGRNLKLSESSAWWFSQAARCIRAHPFWWTKLLVLKVARFFNAVEVADTWSPDFFALYAPRLKLAFITYAMLMPAAVVGLIVLWGRGMRARLIHVLVLATVVSVVIFYVFGRYRMPVVPLFAVLAAAALTEFARHARARQYATLAAMLVAAAVAAALGFTPLPSRVKPVEAPGIQHFNLGVIYQEQLKDDVKAKEEWDLARKQCPGYSKTMSALALLHLKHGDVEQARPLLLDAIKADATDADAHYLLASIYLKDRKPKDAILELEKAVAARPGFLRAWQDLGAMHITQGDYEGGSRVLEEAVKLFPRAESIWVNLGACYYGLRDMERARVAWTRALELAQTPEEGRRIEENLRRLPPERMP